MDHHLLVLDASTHPPTVPLCTDWTVSHPNCIRVLVDALRRDDVRIMCMEKASKLKAPGDIHLSSSLAKYMLIQYCNCNSR